MPSFFLRSNIWFFLSPRHTYVFPYIFPMFSVNTKICKRNCSRSVMMTSWVIGPTISTWWDSYRWLCRITEYDSFLGCKTIFLNNGVLRVISSPNHVLAHLFLQTQNCCGITFCYFLVTFVLRFMIMPVQF